MVIDGSRVLRRRQENCLRSCDAPYPYFTFINKMDRDANDTFDLLDEIEKSLESQPVRSTGRSVPEKDLKGVYDRNTKEVMTFSDTLKGTKEERRDTFTLMIRRCR